jgi:hypothetical protein
MGRRCHSRLKQTAAPCSCTRKKRLVGFSTKKTRKNGEGCLSPSHFGEDGGKQNTELGSAVRGSKGKKGRCREGKEPEVACSSSGHSLQAIFSGKHR